MNDLPEDQSTEAGVRELIDIRDLGQRADSVLHETIGNILRLARSRVQAHVAYQAIFEVNRYSNVLLGTIFQRWGGDLDRFTFDDDTVTLHCEDEDRTVHNYIIPLRWLWTPQVVQPEMDAMIDALVARYEKAQADARLNAVAQEKAQLAALLAKHGNPAS